MKDCEGIERLKRNGDTPIRIGYQDFLTATLIHHQAMGWTLATATERIPNGWIPRVVSIKGDLSKLLLESPPCNSEGEALAQAQLILDSLPESDAGIRLFAASILAISERRGWFQGPGAELEEHLIRIGIQKIEGGQA